MLQIQLTGFLDKDTARFCKELWALCLSAQSNPLGVPKELLEAKKLELIQEKVLNCLSQFPSHLGLTNALRSKLRRLPQKRNGGESRRSKETATSWTFVNENVLDEAYEAKAEATEEPIMVLDLDVIQDRPQGRLEGHLEGHLEGRLEGRLLPDVGAFLDTTIALVQEETLIPTFLPLAAVADQRMRDAALLLDEDPPHLILAPERPPAGVVEMRVNLLHNEEETEVTRQAAHARLL